MIRSSWALGVLVAAAGCGMTAAMQPGLPATPAEAGSDALATAVASAAEIPEVAAVGRAVTALGRRNRVAGYYWVGYTPADFGAGDLRELGAGDGTTFGLGLTFAEAGRAFLEIAFEKTVNHSYAPSLLDDATDPSHQTGHHERFLLGGRLTATAMARMEKQARPYMNFGVSSNKYRVDMTSGAYHNSGVGLYAGLGVEFPLAQKTSFSFDTRYHTWSDTDSNGLNGDFACVAISLLYIGRF